MTRLSWDELDERIFGYGIDRGVVYNGKGDCETWSGLASVQEIDEENDVFKQHVDGDLVQTQIALGSFTAKVDSYSTPELIFEAAGHSGNLYTGQVRPPFFFTYRTLLGNAVNPDSHYEIHLVYNAYVKPTQKTYRTRGDASDPLLLSWDISAKPSKLQNMAASAHFIIDSSVVHEWTLKELEDILYGTPMLPPRFPNLNELLDIFEEGVILRITDHGDGTWTADGPDSAIQMLDGTTFRITWPSAVYISSDTYRISSL